jgi:hypothetical protein
MIDIFKLTDFGNPYIVIGSRAVTRRKQLRGLGAVRKEWLDNIGLDQKYIHQFQKTYGFDEEAFLKDYRLNAVQFGNWMGYSDRADHFLALVQALKHLSEILGTQNLGYNGKLSVALGARGRSGAKAHFEPLQNVINLTKEKGGHSFAHEYGHAIDYNCGAFFSKHPKIYSVSNARATSTSKDNADTDEMRNLMSIVIDGVRSGERYGALVDYAKAMRSYGYWCNNTEIWARTFAQWIALQLRQKGIRDTVLAQTVDTGGVENIPESELKKLSPYIRKIVAINSRALNTGAKIPPATTVNKFAANVYTVPIRKKKKAAAARSSKSK